MQYQPLEPIKFIVRLVNREGVGYCNHFEAFEDADQVANIKFGRDNKIITIYPEGHYWRYYWTHKKINKYS